MKEMNKIKLHAVSRADFIAKNYPNFQGLLDNSVDPNNVPERFYCGGRGGWTFQTLLAMKYYYGADIACSFGPESRKDAINLMHNDDFGSRVKPWRGFTIVVRADRPIVIGADVVVEQNPGIKKNRDRIFIPYWPQPGIKPRQRNDQRVKTVAFFGRVDSFPDEYRDGFFKEVLAKEGIELRIMFDNWTNYQDVDVCISFRKSHNYKLSRKPASKLINNWLGKTVMVCDDEPSYRAIRESELDYLIAKNPHEALMGIMRLRNNSDLYHRMREQGDKRVQVYTREAIAARWRLLLEDIWRKGLHNRLTVGRVLQFGFGKAIRPITKKF